jgi:hypothetical protein
MNADGADEFRDAVAFIVGRDDDERFDNWIWSGALSGSDAGIQ